MATKTSGKRATKASGKSQDMQLGVPPAIFMFRPTTFSYITPDRIKEWEQLMIERVGLAPDMASIQGGHSISGCPSADDCDR